MNGTITWLPIKDAPEDEMVLLYGEGDRHIKVFGIGKYIPNTGGLLRYQFDDITPTHFAYINPPEVNNER